MWKIIQSEWQKMRRCQILLVGIVALGICPLVQYGSWLIMDPALREPQYDFSRLFVNVVWGNTQMFLPISLVMTGGWFIDREYVNDTMKNILTVPVALPKLLKGKLIVTGILALIFGVYSVGITVLTGKIAGLSGLTVKVLLEGGGQIVAASFTTYLVCMPLILIFGQIRGAYLGGAVFTFFLGYSMLFFKSGFLMSAYSFSAALILVGFDMEAYNGAVSPPNLVLSVLGILVMIGLAAFILSVSRPGYGKKGKTTNTKYKRGRGGKKR